MMHATTVAVGTAAVLITGPSGSGKSGLGLMLMGLGATLVADDQTELRRNGSLVLASPPAAIAGLIEARHVGLLRATWATEVPLRLVIDMGAVETERLPPERETSILGCTLPLLQKVETEAFPAAVIQYIKGGRRA